MKKVLTSFALLNLCFCYAQKKPVQSVKKAASPVTVLKTATDSASYAIGVSMATFYNEQGMKNLNAVLIAKAITDVQGKKKTALSEYEANTVLMDYLTRLQQEKVAPNIEAGDAFLATNGKRPEVKTTASGLQFEVLKEGSGQKPTAEDTVITHYAGTLLNGEEFDNSYKRGEPITIPVSGVIKGWTEALQLMPVGSKYKLYIPYQLGYGIHESGAIPGGSVLVFEIELLGIKGK